MPQTLPTDVKVKNIELFLIPVETRVPLKFGTETLSSVTCARAKVTVENREGKTAVGWGETPLSVQWVWPSQTPYSQRHDALIEFCKVLQNAWVEFGQFGHALEIGHSFLEEVLHSVQDQFNEKLVAGGGESMPYLAGLVVASVFDQAIHDAYGVLNEIDIYKTYNSQFMSRDLSSFLSPAEGSSVSFEGKFPSDFLVADAPATLPVWHLVGGLDPLSKEELTGSEPDDDYPVLLRDWIERDGLNCLKIKLRGNDSKWDYDRLEAIGKIADETNLECLTADFNCTVKDQNTSTKFWTRRKRTTRRCLIRFSTWNNHSLTIWKSIASMSIQSPNVNHCFWMKALTIGNSLSSDWNWVGLAWR